MSYQQKYLKYKKKYLQLLELTGGAASGVTSTTKPTDVLSQDGVVKCRCEEVFANPEFGAPRSTIFTRACDYKVNPCYKCGKHICIYCGDEVARITGLSNKEYSAHNIPGKEPTIGSDDAHFGWAPHNERPYNNGSWPTNSGWCLRRPDVLFKKSDRGRNEFKMDDLEKALDSSLEQQREREKRQQDDFEFALRLSEQKECSRCTFLNKPNRRNCKICNEAL